MRGLRMIGTGYRGKEPYENVVDVLRGAGRLCGEEFGFEACLTSRPFTARTLVAGRPGTMLPGRGAAEGADRVLLDLTDGLAALAQAGFAVERISLPDPAPQLGDGQLLIAAPLRVPDRWAPPADRLLLGEAWRPVTVDRYLSDAVLCLDPLFGGYTSLPRAELTGAGVAVYRVAVPTGVVDRPALARWCLRTGAAWRTGEHGPGRDGVGLAEVARFADDLLAGANPRRLRLSLANHALQAYRFAALLGHCGPLDLDELALADLLHDTVVGCRAAHRALSVLDAAALSGALRELAGLGDAVTELGGRVLCREAL